MFFGYLNLDYKIRLPIVLIKSVVFAVCSLFWVAGRPEKYFEVLIMIKQSPFLFCYLLFGFQMF